MKIVKLNRKYNINKYHGFEVALKFDFWNTEARDTEQVCRTHFGDHAWDWKWNLKKAIKGNWATKFGDKEKDKPTPYWIYLRKHSMLTMLKLATDWSDYEQG